METEFFIWTGAFDSKKNAGALFFWRDKEYEMRGKQNCERTNLFNSLSVSWDKEEKYNWGRTAFAAWGTGAAVRRSLKIEKL